MEEPTAPTQPSGPVMSRRARVGWIVLALVAPVAWLAATLVGAPSDATATYPSTSLDSTRHWDSTDPPGVPVAAVFGSSPLRADPEGDGFTPDRVLAVGPSGGALRTMEDWARNPARGTFAIGDRVDYLILGADGSERTVTIEVEAYPLGAALRANVATWPLFAMLAAAGAYVFWRRPEDLAARVLMSMAVFVPLGATAFPFGAMVLDLAGGRGLWPTLVGDGFFALAWGSMLLFALVFPAPVPALVHRPWLIVAPYAFVLASYAVWLALELPRHDSALGRSEVLVSVSATAAKITLPVIALILVHSYRRATVREHRLALRVVLAGVATALVVYLLLGQLSDWVLGAPLVPFTYLPIAFAIPLLALMAAVLRYRLFEIDVLVRRSLLVVAVGFLSAAIFLLVAVLLVGPAWRSIGLEEPRERTWSLLSMISGGLLAFALIPMARYLRRQLGRVAYGAREDPHRVVTELREVGAPETIEKTVSAILDTLVETLRLSYAEIVIDPTPEYPGTRITIGSTQRTPTVVTLDRGDREHGRLLLDTQGSREQFGPSDARLLADIGLQVGSVVGALIANQELRRSREEIVTAREEERRRLRNDMHDQMGAVLAAHSMWISTARAKLRADPDGADERLAKVADSTDAQLRLVKRIIQGLRPPDLDAGGLAVAVGRWAENYNFESQTGGSRPDRRPTLHWAVESNDLEPLPAAVEVAVYNIVLEAGNNVTRHTDATLCHVTITRSPDRLLVMISDDGGGMAADARPGIGLQSMRERAEELGGTFNSAPNDWGGLTITASFPIRPE